jgi:hypothetical protein
MTKLDKMPDQDAGAETANIMGTGAGRVRAVGRRRKRTG